ncbi:MAG TPA: hypothetical protein VHH36_07840 [Candidatus Thermoplasmatota archaeon]|nr:hypothetical protein [Candidatus Thermoplasmatota archaeon]
MLLATPLLALPIAAANHAEHPPCGHGRTVLLTPLGGVDVWTRRCVGAVVWLDPSTFQCNGIHAHVPPGVHVMVFSPDWCETGVLVEVVP